MYLKPGEVAQRSKTNRLDQGDALNSSEQPDTLSNRSSEGRPDVMATNTFRHVIRPRQHHGAVDGSPCFYCLLSGLLISFLGSSLVSGIKYGLR